MNLTDAWMEHHRATARDPEIDAEVRAYIATRADRILDGRSVREHLRVDGVDLWSLVEAELYVASRELLYLYFTLHRLLRGARHIVVEDGPLAVAAMVVARELGVPIVRTHRVRRTLGEIAGRLFVARRALRQRRRWQRSAVPTRPIVFAFEYVGELGVLAPVIERVEGAVLCPLDGRERIRETDAYRAFLLRHPCAEVDIDAELGDATFEGDVCSSAFFVDGGRSPEPLVKETFERVLSARALTRLVRRRVALDELVRDVHPSLVVTANAYGATHRALSDVCRARGVTSLQVPHHTDQLEADVLATCGWSTDHVAVLGAHGRRVLERGAPRGTVHVTGGTALEVAKTTPRPGTHTLLFAAQGLPEEARLVRTLIEVTRDRGRLVIRPHPKHHAALYHVLAAGHRHVRVEREGSIHAALEEVDALVTIGSTSWLAAVVLDRPVLFVSTARVREALPFVGFRCRNERAAIAAELERMFAPSGHARFAAERRTFLDEHTAGPGAAERIAALVCALAGKCEQTELRPRL